MSELNVTIETAKVADEIQTEKAKPGRSRRGRRPSSRTSPSR